MGNHPINIPLSINNKNLFFKWGHRGKAYAKCLVLKSVHSFKKNFVMKKIGLLLTFFLVATSFFAQNREKKRDSDITERYNLSDFTAIDADLGADIYIRQADTFSIVIEGPEQGINRMTLRVKDGKLLITKQYNWQFWNEFEKVRIYITAPLLVEVAFSGAGNIVFQGKWAGEKLDILLEGAHNVTAKDVDINALKVKLYGVGNLTMGGNAQKARLFLNGTGNIDAYDLKIQNARCVVNGVGRLECYVTEELKADVSGLGSVYYRGDPKNVQSSVSGLGKVKAQKGY